MSRSRKKTPISGHTKADTAKKDKQIANRIFRRKTRYTMDQYVKADELAQFQSLHPDDLEVQGQLVNQITFHELPSCVDEVYNVYNFDHDGKGWNVYENWERK